MDKLSKVLLWGTGGICQEVINNDLNCEIIGFIESRRTKDEYKNLPVYDLDCLPEIYDFIIVANKSIEAIYELCMHKNICIEKLIFLFPFKQKYGCQDQDRIKEILGEKNYTNYCSRFGIIKNTFFEQDLAAYQKLNNRPNFAIQEECLWPVVSDKYAMAGTVENYFWQDLWAARLIHKSGVEKHFDIGSRIDGFISHLLSMGIETTVIDVREFPEIIDGLHTIVDDATLLGQVSDESIESMSALCSLEHFGLGRYGDQVNPEACFTCFEAIQKKMKPNGYLYIAVPIGKERVEFNAHRIFYPSTIIDCFSEMELLQFSCTAQGKIEYDVDIHKYDNDEHNGEFRFGLFYFQKKS